MSELYRARNDINLLLETSGSFFFCAYRSCRPHLAIYLSIQFTTLQPACPALPCPALPDCPARLFSCSGFGSKNVFFFSSSFVEPTKVCLLGGLTRHLKQQPRGQESQRAASKTFSDEVKRKISLKKWLVMSPRIAAPNCVCIDK